MQLGELSALCAAVFDLHTGPSAEAAQYLLAAEAVQRGAMQKPALHQLDPHVLNRVFAELEPEALARAGLQQHSACLPDCTKIIFLSH